MNDNCSNNIWKNEPWWKSAVFYQIYVRSFLDSNGDGIGDLEGIRRKLRYIKDLGCDAIYLNPINKSPNDDNGYDISDFYDIMDEFGTIEDFKKLLEDAHSMGIRICMDLVLNHSSDEHPWFIEGRKSKNSKYHDYYIFKEGNDSVEPNNWLSFFGGSAWEYNEYTKEYYLHIFSKKQPDFNYENPHLREEIEDILNFWKDFGIDGVRLDAINHLAKDRTFKDAKVNEKGEILFIENIQNLPKCHDYIKELRSSVDSKDFLFMGEAGGVSFREAFNYTAPNKKELDFLFHFDFHSLGIDYDTLEKTPFNLPKKFKEPLLGWSSLKDEEGWNPLFWSNHDTTRTITRLGDNSLISGKALCLLQMTLRGTPFIYYGDEIGMTNGDFKYIDDFNDVGAKKGYELEVKSGNVSLDKYIKKLRLTSRDNSRTPMQWNNDNKMGFTTGTPWMNVFGNKDRNVQNELENPNSLLNFYKLVINLRKENEVLIFGDTREFHHNNENVISYVRSYENHDSFLIVVNLSPINVPFKPFSEIPMEFKGSKSLISNLDETVELIEEMNLKPYEGLIFKLEK